MRRLKTRSQFQAALAGEKVASTLHFVLHRCATDVPMELHRGGGAPRRPLFGFQDIWVGAMVPKRWAKRAVTRNAIKRQIYNVSAKFRSVLPHAAHVVRQRATLDRKTFLSAESDVLRRAVRQELIDLFTRATARTPANGEGL